VTVHDQSLAAAQCETVIGIGSIEAHQQCAFGQKQRLHISRLISRAHFRDLRSCDPRMLESKHHPLSEAHTPGAHFRRLVHVRPASAGGGLVKPERELRRRAR